MTPVFIHCWMLAHIVHSDQVDSDALSSFAGELALLSPKSRVASRSVH